jgi:predicted house-cleaning noncanonical NTP pyrophosphatase (MazG superfamily)
MKKHYYKLVRDRIPEIIEADGKVCEVYRASPGGELRGYGLMKLREEVQEFVENPSAEEAADILEVLTFICDREGITPGAIKAARISKRVSRGGFDMGMILGWVEEE